MVKFPLNCKLHKEKRLLKVIFIILIAYNKNGPIDYRIKYLVIKIKTVKERNN